MKENRLQQKQKKNSVCKLKDREQWKGRSTKMSIKLRRLRLVQYRVQLTIAKVNIFPIYFCLC